MILPETLSGEAARIAERMLQAFERTPFDYEGHLIQLSYSAGVSEYGGEGSADDLLKKADSALYRSKAKGRRQVTVEESVVSPSSLHQ